jgi:hypothetical protein
MWLPQARLAVPLSYAHHTCLELVHLSFRDLCAWFPILLSTRMMLNVHPAGGCACLVANNVDDEPFAMTGPSGPLMSIPSGMIRLADFNQILPYARAGQLIVAVQRPAETSSV